MTIKEWCKRQRSHGSGESVTYVVDSEEAFNSFDDGGDLREREIIFTLCSAMKPEYYLKEEFVNAPIYEFMALGKDEFVVMLDIYHEEDNE